MLAVNFGEPRKWRKRMDMPTNVRGRGSKTFNSLKSGCSLSCSRHCGNERQFVSSQVQPHDLCWQLANTEKAKVSSVEDASQTWSLFPSNSQQLATLYLLQNTCSSLLNFSLPPNRFPGLRLLWPYFMKQKQTFSYERQAYTHQSDECLGRVNSTLLMLN